MPRGRETGTGTKPWGLPVSNRGRLSPEQAALASALGPLDGARIPGGCDSCNAYQTVQPVNGGVWLLAVHHDGWCPVLAQVAGPEAAE
jgi:hypothetical protein